MNHRLSPFIAIAFAFMATAMAQCSDPSLSELDTWLTSLRSETPSTCSVLPSNKQKVLLVGIDGFRADAAAMLPLPNIRRLMAMGTWSFWAKVQSTATAVSGPGWASLLTGFEPEDHKVDGNDDLRDLAHPTVLNTVKAALGKKVAASVTWGPLINDFIAFYDPSTLDASYDASSDKAMVDKAIEWVSNEDYDLLFVDFDEVDAAGHSFGFDGYNEPYFDKVIETDGHLGRLVDAVMSRPAGEEWLIILTTDHGGKNTGHGDTNYENRRIPLIVAGNSPRIHIGPAPGGDPGSHLDVLPTIHHYWGIPIPEASDGQVFGFLDYTRSEPPAPPTCLANPSTCGCPGGVLQSDYRGTINKTKSGKTCQAWSSQSPQTHTRTPQNYPDAGLESNYCRNPDGEAGAWCYTTDKNTRWEFCDIPVCSLATSAPVASPTDKPVASPTAAPVASPTEPPVVGPSACPASDPNTCGCANIQQSDYRGTLSVTQTGKTCQAWASQSPHSHTRTAENYPDFGLESNYCRNPDGEDRAWCYTTDDNSRWEFCDVPACGAPTTPPAPSPPTAPPACASADPDSCGCDEILQADYRGTIAVTETGKTCQAWASQSPQSHTRTPENYPGFGLESNYCRNPDGEARAWCYTTDDNSRWEFCDIPTCGLNRNLRKRG